MFNIKIIQVTHQSLLNRIASLPIGFAHLDQMTLFFEVLSFS